MESNVQSQLLKYSYSSLSKLREVWEIYIRLPSQILLCLSNKNACFVIKEEYKFSNRSS